MLGQVLSFQNVFKMHQKCTLLTVTHFFCEAFICPFRAGRGKFYLHYLVKHLLCPRLSFPFIFFREIGSSQEEKGGKRKRERRGINLMMAPALCMRRLETTQTFLEPDRVFWQKKKFFLPDQTFSFFWKPQSREIVVVSVKLVKNHYQSINQKNPPFLVWRDPQGPNFPSPQATRLALRLDCSTAALTTPQKVLSIWKLVELKMLDFGDRTRTGISILTSAADPM